MRKLFEYVRFLLEILGAFATIFVIYQAVSFFFFEKKAISAAYKFQVLAQDGSAFNARQFLDPNISDWKKIVQVSVLIWNSGNEPVEKKDVRRDIAIAIDSSSKVIEVHPGVQRSNKLDDFKFQDDTRNSYKLTWDVLDPDDFFETHFLIGTNLDNDSLKKIVQVEGLIFGNIKVGFRELSTIMISQLVGFLLFGIPLAFALFFLVAVWANQNKRVKAFLDSLKPQYGGLFIVFTMSLSVGFAFYSAALASSHLWYVPSWLEPGLHLK